MTPARPEDEKVILPEPSLVGQTLEGKYLILGALGAGGMGMVYEGRNLAVGRRVAIKTMLRRHRHDAGLVERFEREAQAAALIEHPGIVDILDLGHDAEGLPYIVMEHLDGEALYDSLSTQGPLAPGKAVRIAVQILEALAKAHAAGVVHRDIKPENVFLSRRPGGEEVVKILDFGVAKLAPPWTQPRSWVTAAGCAVGTPGYMAPEQALGTAVDQRSDLYAVGVVLYEMLAGSLPCNFNQEPGERVTSLLSRMLTRESVPLRRVAPWVNEDLAAIVGRAMARVPGSRFQTANELLEALQPFTVDDEPREAPRPARTRPVSIREPRMRVSMPLQSALAAAEDIATRETVRVRHSRRTSSYWLLIAILASALTFGALAARYGGGSPAAASPAAEPADVPAEPVAVEVMQRAALVEP